MAMTTEPASTAQSISRNRQHSSRSAGPGRWLLSILLLLGAAAVVVAMFPQITLPGFGTVSSEKGALTHIVAPGRLRVTIVEDGSLESASNLDVKCHVAGGSTILWIVEDGKIVEEGEELVHLDRAAIEEELSSQKIVYEKAVAGRIQAKEDYEAARISVSEYAEGIFVQELQEAEANITIALENLRSAQNMLAHTERMVRKNFATPLQFEADQFAVQRAELELATARTVRRVLEEFTRPKTLRELEAARDAADAHRRSEQAAYELEKARLERLQQQLHNCVLKAPQAGMVVYANETSRWGSTASTIEEGAAVREGQTILRLPDLTRMQVKVNVHEARIEQVQRGLPARISILDRDLRGRVASIANQPEPTSFFQASVKEYATRVSIDGETSGLRPGMTAAVEILIADLRNVLTVPVSAVVEQRGRFYAWVKTPDGPERRPLVLGYTNDREIEIRDGLAEGDEVYLNPRAVVPAARVEDDGSVEEDEEHGGDSAAPAGDASPGRPVGSPPSPADGPPTAGGPGATETAGRGQRGGFDIMQFDTDGDGKLSREEAEAGPEWLPRVFEMIDTNKDGYIDRAEAAAARQRQREAQSGGAGPAGFSGGGSQ